jgi:hypothetical protein
MTGPTVSRFWTSHRSKTRGHGGRSDIGRGRVRLDTSCFLVARRRALFMGYSSSAAYSYLYCRQ